MPPFILALASIAISVTAQFLFKHGVRQTSSRSSGASLIDTLTNLALNPWILLGFLLYGIGAVVWLSVLSRWDVSKAYPLVGLGFVLTLGIGAFLGESVTPLRGAGVLCICLGVGLVARS
jgi:drug/metabolite transporter (DMT)-like permease